MEEAHKLTHKTIDTWFSNRPEPTINWNTVREKAFYCLCMFPYPSGQLHMGHVRNYTLGDVVSRYKRLNDYQVFHPIGWDAFGLPAENAAIKNNTHPNIWTEQNIQQMRVQLKALAIDYNWSHELQTNDPTYYRWQQLLFIKMYEKGLVVRKNSIVNWDPVDNTVLANEQVIDGCGWRSGAPVEKRQIEQWFLKITDYADRLLDDLDTLEGHWPEKVLTMQRNWIGMSQGHEVRFAKNSSTGLTEDIIVYTTRLDTVMGVTAVLIAAEHPIAQTLAREDTVLAAFIEQAGSTDEGPKKGFCTKYQVMHPITKQYLDVWVVNYVLMDYGTGAVMCVPAHCDRDKEFAAIYNIASIVVVENNTLINSGSYNNMSSELAMTAIIQAYPEFVTIRNNLRLRDWGISRQRYWGCPIPMVHCPNCGAVPVLEQDLPVVLPLNIPYKHDHSTLQHPDFLYTNCPNCQAVAQRETDTFDTFFDSSWYFMRFLDPHASIMVANSSWLPVDLYIGGIEHAILHLLYARFITKVLFDFQLAPCSEPFKNLLTQGMVLNNGCKMSKSKGNVVMPNEMLTKFGVDSTRLFMMFQAPPEQSLEWSENGLEGMQRFCQRLIKMAYLLADKKRQYNLKDELYLNCQSLLKCIDRDYQSYRFNTVVSGSMKWLNLLQLDTDNVVLSDSIRALFEDLLILLSPIAPGITDYIWQNTLQHTSSIHTQSMPVVDELALSGKMVSWVIQINGKFKLLLNTEPNLSEEKLVKMVMELPIMIDQLHNKTIQRTIIVANRLINFVL